MSIKNTSTTYRTISVSSDGTPISPPGQYIEGSRNIVSSVPGQYIEGGRSFVSGQYIEGGRTIVSPVPGQYTVGNGYETVRYLMPVQQQMMPQQQMQYMLVNQAPQYMQQMVSPVYIPSVTASSLEGSESIIYQQNVNGNTPSVFSHTSNSTKSPEPSFQEEEEEEETVEFDSDMVNLVEEKVSKREEKVSQVDIKSEVRDADPVEKMDTRFFGELLAEVYRKNSDIYTCISEHVAKIRGRKHLLDPSNDYKVDKENIEALIPKGASELTKQQIRYLLQTRTTADKTMRLLLATFSSLREELLHMAEDLKRLESDKETLERDLSFKADQVQQYDRLLEAVRDNNRQLQASLKQSSASQLSLESQLMSNRSTDSSLEYRIKELEGNLRVQKNENDMLKQKLSGQGSSTIQVKTEELSRQYAEQLAALRQEKDKELQSLRTQMTRITTEYTTEKSSDNSLEIRIKQLLTKLEEREVTIRRQEEEIKRLQQVKQSDSSKNITTTTITKRYQNQYPLLGLLTDDYQSNSPIKDTKTIVIKSQMGR